ncbi:MAG: lactonase family protein [Pisciglobus halotolerans]|nr:lactonase family protein [Pisciglobus halotolerans]
MLETIFLGTYTKRESKGIYQIALNTETKTLENLTLAAETTGPTYLTTAMNNTYLYAVLGGDGNGGIAAYKKKDSGNYVQTDTALDEGSGPCYVAYDTERGFVYTANYHKGQVAVYEAGADGAIELMDIAQHTGSSVHKNQDQPHAHYFDLTPDKKYVLACDLGNDTLYTYSVNQEGKLTKVTTTDVAPGTGPRHLVFAPNENKVYLFGELSSEVIALDYDNESGSLEAFQTVSTIPADHTSFNGGAAIRISDDGKFLYASNRGHDSIAVFAVSEEDGTLTLIEYVPTEGAIPRDFDLNSTDQFLVVAHQDSDNLTLFERDSDTGKLKLLEKDVYAPEAVCVHFS